MAKLRLFTLLLCALSTWNIGAQDIGHTSPIDSLHTLLSERALLQEKVYLHTDNQCYFAGDTLWYKAYLLRADNHRPSQMSKILYVELLTPDGYLVERQRIIVEHNTQSHGQFALPDTIYSGYYELRAYTRWQLNFNVSHKPHNQLDNDRFYSSSLADDYYRTYQGLYSRVIPIYEKPQQPGDYATKRIISRPRRRQAALPDEQPSVTFYPEGGHLVEGMPCRVAFEVLDGYGKPLDLQGTLTDGTAVRTLSDGRGLFDITPQSSDKQRLTLHYQDRTYDYPLPQVQTTGAVIRHDAESQQIQVSSQGTEIGAVSITCRGRLVAFEREQHSFSTSALPTGVNEVTAYDMEGRPLAVRQIFVNHHDVGRTLPVTLTMQDGNQTVETISAPAYRRMNLHTEVDTTRRTLRTLSISVRDQRSDEPTYDDGDILTELLLAGDLRGFVAHPAYYFEADDATHRQRLDLLMMIQGWRKYAPVTQARYEAETNFALQGQVHKLNSSDKNDFDLLSLINEVYASNASADLSNPCFTISDAGQLILLGANEVLPTPKGLEYVDMADTEFSNGPVLSTESSSTDASNTNTSDGTIAYQSSADTEHVSYLQNERMDHGKTRYKNPPMVEAELSKNTDVVGAVTMADASGRFSFALPPYYDQAYLFMTAYRHQDSARMCLTSREDKERLNPFACPAYYVRQEYFYPIYSQPYAWQQTHSPEQADMADGPVLSAVDSMLYDRILDNVTVKSHNIRKLHRFDKSKPAFEIEFSRLLNLTTDCGLHYTGYNNILFWEEAAHALFGNMGQSNDDFGIRAKVAGHTFLKTYRIPANETVGYNMTAATLALKTDPRRIWKVRVYTDYDMRNDVGREENRGVPDVEFELIELPGGGRRTINRDRRLILDGFAYPEDFYHPDYSGVVLDEPTDYRRTLYWNANAHPDADGNLDITFYTGSRPVRMQVSISGVGADGQIYH